RPVQGQERHTRRRKHASAAAPVEASRAQPDGNPVAARDIRGRQKALSLPTQQGQELSGRTHFARAEPAIAVAIEKIEQAPASSEISTAVVLVIARAWRGWTSSR